MPGFRVSNAALKDLRDIGRYTQSKWGRGQRVAYLDGLNRQFNALTLNPRLAAERQDFDPPVRIHPHERHLILYVIDGGGILIVRVLHQSMDVARHLSS